MYPTYHSIVEDASKVQKHNVLNQEVTLGSSASAIGIVRIVDIAGSPSQSTDKGIAGPSIPAGDKDTHEPTHSR